MPDYTTIKTEESFSASHFVHTADIDSPCRRLHGHDWRVEVIITGKVQEDGMVMDFRKIKEVVKKLDHKTLVPEHLCCEYINQCSEDIEFAFPLNIKRYSIPREDILIMEIESTTAENLARYFITELGYNELELSFNEQIIVRVWESTKSYAEVIV